MISEVHIFDMDGTIVDSSHRYRTIIDDNGNERIDLPHWRDNQHLAMNDSLLPMASHYQMLLEQPDIYVVIATSRVVNEPDHMFISEVLGAPDYLIHRLHNGDNRRAHDLKGKALRSLLNLQQFSKVRAKYFYEDNFEVLHNVCNMIDAVPVFVPSNQGH